MLHQTKEKDNEIAELRRNKKSGMDDLHKHLQEKDNEVEELSRSKVEVVRPPPQFFTGTCGARVDAGTDL